MEFSELERLVKRQNEEIRELKRKFLVSPTDPTIMTGDGRIDKVQLSGEVKKILLPTTTAENDFVCGSSTLGTWVKKTLAEVKTILGLGTAAYTAASDYAVAARGVITGEIKLWPTTTAPDNYLLCDGASYLRTDYAALFAIIGTAFGAADGTHFNVPDIRGRVPVGKSADTEFDTLGETGGEKTHVLTVAEMATHKHNVAYHYASGGALTKHVLTASASAIAASDAAMIDTATQGSDTAHNNLQPYLTLNFIIKT